MGEVKVAIELENTKDRAVYEGGYLAADKIRSMTVQMVVDTGAVLVMLPQDLVEALGLSTQRKAIVTYADERKEERKEEWAIAGPLTVRFGDRSATTECIVGPPASEPLLGQVPLEVMDLLVDPVQRRLTPRPESPYLPMLKLK